MSRIGKKPVVIPVNVEVKIDNSSVVVKGARGTLSLELHPRVHAEIKEAGAGKAVFVTVNDPELKSDRALWGLFRSLIANIIFGVKDGFSKKLEVNGIGYKVQVSPKQIVLDVGYSHEVQFPLPEGISAELEKNVITLTGADKQLVGETAAAIRRIRKPEPYKGTGIKYLDEVIRRKAGKAATKTAA